MSTHLHHVTIAGTDDDPTIEFSCHGDRDSECHSYPDCDCERWDRDTHEHPFVQHDECWMHSWFREGAISPYTDSLTMAGYTVGMSGPIDAEFDVDFIDWEFLPPEVVEQSCAAVTIPAEATRPRRGPVMSDNVIPLGPIPAHLTCVCGSAWWNATVRIEGQKVTGYGLPLTCPVCGKETQP